MPLTVAVIGAGIAGAGAARTLIEAGHAVRIFDKGRAPGGRASTRWYDSGRQFDHGCAMFTAQTPAFVQVAERWVQQGVAVAVEQPDKTGLHRVYTGTPGMGAITAHLTRGLSVRCGVGPGGGEVWRVSRDGPRYRLYEKQGANFEPVFDAVVVATPAPQAATLLGFMPSLSERMKKVTMTATWTLMVEFEAGEATGALTGGSSPVIELSSGPLKQVIRDSAKRPAGPQRAAWVAHATDEWTREHLELEPGQVEPLMLAALREAAGGAEPGSVLAGVAGEPTFIKAHRWRYARVAQSDPEPFALEADRRIGVCGDAFTSGDAELSPRFGTVEAAYLSGVGVARALAGALAPNTSSAG